MSSKMQQRIQHARDRDVWVFKLPRQLWKSRRECYSVYAEGAWTHSTPMTHRQAKNLAYSISIAKKVTLEVTVFDADGNVVSRSKS